MYVDENGEFLGTLLDVASAVASAVDFVKKPSIKKAVVLAVDVAAAVLPGVPSTGAVKVAKAAAKVAAKAGDAISAGKAAKTAVKATTAAVKTVSKATTVAKTVDKAADVAKAVDKAADVAKTVDKVADTTKVIDKAVDTAKVVDNTADVAKAADTTVDVVTSPAPTVVKETAETVGEAAVKADDAGKVVKTDYIATSDGTIIPADKVKANSQYDRLEVEFYSGKSVRPNNALDDWDNFLGPNQTDIDPFTGKKSLDRIWSSDGTKSIRFGDHEMSGIGTKRFHYHRETWYGEYVLNEVQRIQPR